MRLKASISFVLITFLMGSVWSQTHTNSTVVPTEHSVKPVFIDTGNPEEDAKRYEEAKNQWIQANQREYQQLSTANADAPTDKVAIVKKALSIDELPGFPVRTNTGNREQDELNYKLAKEKWYAENKELLELFYQENAKRNSSNSKPTEQ
jgi:hypothetical protein